jgi:xyloglucan-specific exo-beta-1,4-glucanase
VNIKDVVCRSALVAASFVILGAASGDVFAQASYRWRNVQIVGGGYVPGIVFSQTEPGLAYARTDIGGAYRWNGATGRWIPLLDWVHWDDWGLTGVDSLATDPVDPNRLYVLAGTYTNGWDPKNGAILRSTDRGRTFDKVELPFKSGGNMPGRNMGERLAIDPNANRILYLGARSGNGLWRSEDHGATWARVTSFPATGTYRANPNDPNGLESDPLGVVWVVFDKTTGSPGSPTQSIYVGVADLGQSVYRSTDAGVTWAALAGQPTSPAFMPHHAVLASTGMLYITYNNNGGPYDGGMGDVWRFDTRASVWAKITPDPSSATNNWFGYGGITVDAQNPNTIMVSELNRWWPEANIWRSTNGGATWTSMWDWGPWPTRTFRYTHDISASPWLTFNQVLQLPERAPRLGWMIGDIEIDPFDSNRMLYGTGATIYGTDDLTNWDRGVPFRLAVKAQGLEETSVQDLISPPAGAPLLSALGDLGGFRHDDLGVVPAKLFDNPTTTTGTSLDFAQGAPNIIARVGNGGGTFGFSSDGGATWSPGNPAGASGGNIAVSANGRSLVWSPGNRTVRYSLDNGATWTASAGVPRGARVGSDRFTPGKYYAAAGGAFYVSIDHGATFTRTAAAGLPADGVRFKASTFRTGDLWLTAGWQGLWRSTNGGVSFTKLASVQEADSIGFGRPLRDRGYPALYSSAKIGGVRGIFRSDDAGLSWVRINDDRHQYAYTGAAITGDPRVYGRVYVSTNGRGVIYGEPGTAED